MALRPIVRLGHPALRTPAEPLDPQRIDDDDVQTLIDDMLETMAEAGGVGLAAPQLGIGVQLFVYMAIDPDDHDPEADGPPAEDSGGEGSGAAEDRPEPELKVLVNPALDPVPGELVYDWEGCLSIPDLRGLVPRHPEVRVHGLDRRGNKVDERIEGYEARIVQHEYDHLNGVVFLDRMRELQSLAFTAEWEEFLTEDDGGSGAVG